MLDCAESLTTDDGHVLTDDEVQVINARLLMNALIMLDDYEMPGLIRRLNDENKSHDKHTELLLKLIDHEFDKLRQERKDNDFLKKVTHNDKD